MIGQYEGQLSEAELDRLEKLGDLKKKGVLTAAEFREEKKKILTG